MQPFVNLTIIAILCAVLIQTELFARLSNIAMDFLFRVRGERETSQSIVIVGVDDYSLKKLVTWPFPRRYHAELLQQLSMAKSVGYDLIFDHKKPSDTFFASTIGYGPPVTFAVGMDYRGRLLYPAESFEGKVGLGHIETLLGDDGIVREVELFKSHVAAFSLEMADQVDKIRFLSSNDKDKRKRVINFYGPEFTFLYVSYVDVLQGKYPPEFFKDRYVLIGLKALSQGDKHNVPFRQEHGMPGVEIQATILNNIVDNSFIRKNIDISIFTGAVLLLAGLWLWPRQREMQNMLCVSLASFFVLTGSVVAFSNNVFVDPLIPLLAVTFCYFLHLVEQWLGVTGGMIREIHVLDNQLRVGLETVRQTIPPLVIQDREGSLNDQRRGILTQYIDNLHAGIRALAVQHTFINHLMSRETPPLLLYERITGEIVLANDAVNRLWRGVDGVSESLPGLEDFINFLEAKRVRNGIDDQRKPVNGIAKIENCVSDILVYSNGTPMYYRVVLHLVDNPMLNLDGVLASFTDVTEIRRLEKIKGEVMNIVSHELRLPLTSILGFSEMLTDSLAGKEKDYAEQITRQAKRLAELIDSFLDLSRIESGKEVMKFYPFDFQAVIYDAGSVVYDAALEKDIELKFNLPLRLTPLKGDAAMLTQAVVNLLDNSVKFGPVGSVVRVELQEREKEMCLTITDSGPGVADEDKSRIFQTFIRGRDISEATGFGLGLSLVKKVVEGHGGTVSVTDARGGGAVFTLNIPKLNKN
ncbi:His Kinase A (phospho-acceptor) domain-containing protein [Desulforhopalus singaporensis]|uniref:histidine kinase n=1 Tax=Desulforhopalus singaporensis TaxID=91360 RepID=A0A1H0JD05_9BACT|nr:His Kinase A (phospho-acceptor) domain-containing protein [Desulforhopalus singaporensis]